MKFCYGIWPDRDPVNAGKPVLGPNGLPFPTPGHFLCRNNGKVIINILDFGVGHEPERPICRYLATFLSWHKDGYAIGMGNVPDDALADLAKQCSTDLETLKVYCSVYLIT